MAIRAPDGANKKKNENNLFQHGLRDWTLILVSPFQIISRGNFFWVRWVWDPARGSGAEGAKGAEEVGQGEVSTIIVGMLESSFWKYSTLLVIQLFPRRLCLCILLCLCICVPYSFLNSYYYKLSENVWVWGCGASRSEIWWDVTMAGQPNERTNKER